MYTYKVGISEQEHDQFVKSHPQNNVLQSSAWAKVKDNWRNERIGFYEDNRLVAVASVLIQPLPLGFSMIYIPRGPIMDYTNTTLVVFVVQSLKIFAKKCRALTIKFDPNLHLKAYKINDASNDVYEKEETLEAIRNLEKAGVKWSGRTTQMYESIQPRYQANVYTKKDIAQSFPKRTKGLMKDAHKKGVVVKRVGSDRLSEFSRLMELTQERKNVSLRNYDYFKKMADIYGEDLFLYLATVDVSKRLNDYKELLENVEIEITRTQEHQKKRLTKLREQKESFEKHIAELSGLGDDRTGEVAVAGVLAIRFGDAMELLYAGMDDTFKRFYPQYLVYPTVFEQAYENNIVYANMGGVEGTLDDGLTKFKASFDPMIEEYIGEFSVNTSVLSPLFMVAYNMRKKRVARH